MKPHLLAKVAGRTYEERSNRDKLAGLVLASWGRPDAKTGEERISDDEFRKVVFGAGDPFRARALWQLEWWSKDNGESGEFWKPLGERFLRQVWPIQKSGPNPTQSARLIELAFSDENSFIAISDAILPIISKIERDHISLPSIRRDEGNIVDKHPKRVLEILYLALPENANIWPYQIHAPIERIVVADQSLFVDPR